MVSKSSESNTTDEGNQFTSALQDNFRFFSPLINISQVSSEKLSLKSLLDKKYLIPWDKENGVPDIFCEESPYFDGDYCEVLLGRPKSNQDPWYSILKNVHLSNDSKLMYFPKPSVSYTVGEIKLCKLSVRKISEFKDKQFRSVLDKIFKSFGNIPHNYILICNGDKDYFTTTFINEIMTGINQQFVEFVDSLKLKSEIFCMKFTWIYLHSRVAFEENSKRKEFEFKCREFPFQILMKEKDDFMKEKVDFMKEKDDLMQQMFHFFHFFFSKKNVFLKFSFIIFFKY